MFRNLLIAVDESDCAKQAAEVGLEFAQRVGAKVRLLHVMQPPPRALGVSGKSDAIERYGEELLKPWKEKVGSANLLQVHGENVAQTLVETALAQESDLIVMGTHGREGLQRMLLGSVAERVCRIAPIPVMLVRQSSPTNNPLFMKVLAPIDGSETSKQALEVAQQLCIQTGAELQLVCVIPEAPMPVLYPLTGAVPFPSYQETYQSYREEAKKIMQEALAGCRVSNVYYQFLDSNQTRTAQVITDYARQQQSDLIVMGTHGRTGLDYALLGSVAEGVSHHATVPVLLVRANLVPKHPGEAKLLSVK